MMIFIVIYVYLVYILSLNYLWTDIKKIKPAVQNQQKVKRLKVHFSGAACFEKI